jgi:aldehyde dehydrogenase (NAD+)
MAVSLTHPGPWQQYVAGSFSDGGGAPLPVENPYTEQAFAEIARSTIDDVDRAVASARAAQDDGPWPTLSRRDRSLLLWRFAEAVDARREELLAVHIAETGMYRVLAEGPGVAQPIEWLYGYAELAGREWDHPIPPAAMDVGLGAKLAGGMVHQEPMGVVSAIVPFNFPFFVAVHKVGAALAAGCSVVLKASELTPLSCSFLARAAADAELPAGALEYVVGEADVGRRMVEHPGVDCVSFTGSTAVGRDIAAVAGAGLKKVVLELGGKSAAVVLDDADLAGAAPILLGQFSHGGQGCALNTRLVVHESVADEVVATLTSMMPFLAAGDPADAGTYHAPQITAAARERVLGFIERGRHDGAELVAGGGPITDQPHGHWVQPTLFDRCPVDADVAQEEIFGPVLVVHRFSTDEEAIAIANNSRYGLWGSIWTRDLVRGTRLARRIRTGAVGVNGTALNFHAPFGGVKESGIGREFGEYGVREFFEPKSVSWMP